MFPVRSVIARQNFSALLSFSCLSIKHPAIKFCEGSSLSAETRAEAALTGPPSNFSFPLLTQDRIYCWPCFCDSRDRSESTVDSFCDPFLHLLRESFIKIDDGNVNDSRGIFIRDEKPWDVMNEGGSRDVERVVAMKWEDVVTLEGHLWDDSITNGCRQ